MSAVTEAMLEWARAIRGDWSDIDGRSVKAAIEDWVQAIEGRDPQSSWTLAQHGADLGLCPQGGGHWTEHCALLGCEVDR